MIMPDVNVLVHAFRPDSSDHKLCKTWLEDELTGGGPVGFSSVVLAGLVRICTHPRIFKNCDRVEEATAFCDFLLGLDASILVHPGDNHWSIFTALCRHSDASGNLVQDAWYAALAIEQGAEWATMDRDFSRFPDVRLLLLA